MENIMFITHRSTPSSPRQRIQSFIHRIRTLPSPPKKKLSLDLIGRQHIQPYARDMSRCLDKIGSSPAKKYYQPTEQQQRQFRAQRYRQLKSDLSSRKQKKVAFDFQLDEIVLDCYDYKEEHGRRSIWKQYRGEVDQLSFRVLVLKKGRGR